MSMSAIGTTRIVNPLQALSLILSLLVLIGWGTLAYAAKPSVTAQHQACERVGELKVSLGQVMAERDEARAQLAAAEEEVADLKAARDRLTAEREETQAQLATAQQEIAALTKSLEDLQPKPRKRGASAP
jgi:septal ring factor EnvC (AmiA/AmiB activator)